MLYPLSYERVNCRNNATVQSNSFPGLIDCSGGQLGLLVQMHNKGVEHQLNAYRESDTHQTHHNDHTLHVCHLLTLRCWRGGKGLPVLDQINAVIDVINGVVTRACVLNIYVFERGNPPFT